VDQALLQQAFEVFGHRPQFFMAALGQVLSPLGPERALRGGLAGGRAATASPGRGPDGADYLGLKPTEQAVLWRMLEQGPRFRPYDAEALRFYRDKTGHPGTQPRPSGPWKPCASACRRWCGNRPGANTRWKTRPCTAGSKSAARPANGPAAPQGLLPLDDD
jgi:hypothetical protein